MFKNWFSQGLITNIVSWALIAAGGVVVTLVARNLSTWTVPVMYGLGASPLLAIVTAAVRIRGPRPRRIITPSNAKDSIRECLDRAQIGVRNSPLDGWIFNYVVVLNGRRISVGQQKGNPENLYFSTSITFTDEDNRLIDNSPGGGAGVTKSLRIGLSAIKINYSGVGFPFKQVSLFKHVFMGERFGEYEFMQVLLDIECAFVLATEITTVPLDRQIKPASQ